MWDSGRGQRWQTFLLTWLHLRYELLVLFRRRRLRSNPWYTHYEATRTEEYGDSLAETGRQRYYRQVREIRDEFEISHDEARTRWSEFYAPGGVPIKPVRRIQLAVRASLTNQRTCPFCRDSIYPPEEGGPDYVCTACQAHYHLDCFEDELGGRCATLGCSTRRVIGRAGAGIRARGRRNRLQDDAELLVARDAAQRALERAEADRAATDQSEAQGAPQGLSGVFWNNLPIWATVFVFLLILTIVAMAV